MLFLKFQSFYLVKFALVLGVLFSMPSYAEGDSPYPAVKKIAGSLVAALKADPEKFKNNPEAYKEIVETILVPAVDFETISKFVMGKKYYLAASEEQRSRFASAFKDSLVSTYSTGLSIFDSQEISVLPPEEGSAGKSMQAVNMEVKTAEGTIFPLRFTMRKDGAGDWKIVNVILNGVNVAKAYNSHFSESMAKYGGNMDELIANWNAKISTEEETLSSAK